jgi:hypothetical protein
MTDLDFLVHIPFLRIEEPTLSFGRGRLYRMPFERYNNMTLGAFEEQRAQYDATAPVFFSFTVSIPEEGLERRADEAKGIKEIKLPTAQTAMLDELGLNVVNWAHATLVAPAWSALLLTAPAAAFAPPRWSQTFIGLTDGFTFSIGGDPTVAVRIQGEADHEYLFMADAVSKALSSDVIASAAALIDPLQEWERVPELHAALTSLRATGLPMLSRQDRLTIAVQALESLLLPEVQTTLKRTFARRVSALLTPDGASAAPLSELAADLYTFRSESVHGAELEARADAVQGAYAEQMLAGAIRSLGGLVSSGRSLEQLRAELDTGAPLAGAAAGFELQSDPVGRASEFRLARPVPSSDVLTATSSMVAPENRVICWSPLIGLTTEPSRDDSSVPIGDPPAALVMPLLPRELYDLEDIVAALSTRETEVAWFRREGRTFRNTVAHGEFRSDSDTAAIALDTLTRLASDVLLAFVTTWNNVDADARRRGPTALLTASATRLST